ncbi:hypothetical protein pdam_00014636, partial [Pocillopora damicornis]
TNNALDLKLASTHLYPKVDRDSVRVKITLCSFNELPFVVQKTGIANLQHNSLNRIFIFQVQLCNLQPHSGEQLNMAAASERNGSGQSLEDLLDNEGTTAGALVLTAFMTTATQPLTCVRLLMQVGHEPISPTESTTFLGTKVLRLPSFFQYACEDDNTISTSHVKKINGWSGLYRGLLPSPGLWADMHLVKKAHINHKTFDLFILTSLSIAYLLIKKQAPRYNKRDRTSPTRRGMIPLLTPRDDIQQDID